MRKALLSTIVAAMALLVPALDASGADAAPHPSSFFGTWDVNIKLVTASGAVNPNYKPGDIRIDVWRFAGDGARCALTTKDGTVQGAIRGTVASFQTDVPLDGIIVMRVHIEAHLTSSGSMRGTINADYWDSRFGYKVGMDAWSLRGQKR